MWLIVGFVATALVGTLVGGAIVIGARDHEEQPEGRCPACGRGGIEVAGFRRSPERAADA